MARCSKHNRICVSAVLWTDVRQAGGVGRAAMADVCGNGDGHHEG